MACPRQPTFALSAVFSNFNHGAALPSAAILREQPLGFLPEQFGLKENFEARSIFH
jgi:hypothetical protein